MLETFVTLYIFAAVAFACIHALVANELRTQVKNGYALYSKRNEPNPYGFNGVPPSREHLLELIAAARTGTILAMLAPLWPLGLAWMAYRTFRGSRREYKDLISSIKSD